jgi:hypothetical protein
MGKLGKNSEKISLTNKTLRSPNSTRVLENEMETFSIFSTGFPLSIL